MRVHDSRLSSVDGPSRTAVYSPIGWGKTILGCHLPNVVSICAENGVPRDLGFRVPELHPRNWLDLFSIVHSLTFDAHDHRSVFFDTLDWIEPLIYSFLLERDSERETEVNPYSRKLLNIEDYGWGKGYVLAEAEMRKLLAVLDEMQYRRGIHVMFAMHEKVKTFKNADGPDYDRHEPKCHERVWNVVFEWVENAIYGKFRVDASKMGEDKERNKRNPERAVAKANPGLSPRIVCTQKTAAYEAKNRLRLPPEFPLGDPNELISILLGEQIGDAAKSQWSAPQDRPVGRHTPFTGPGPAAIAAATSTPTRTDGPGSNTTNTTIPSGHIDGGAAFLAEADRRKTEEPPRDRPRWDNEPPSNIGVPAHHESRKAEEDRRRNDALDKAAGRDQGAQSLGDERTRGPGSSAGPVDRQQSNDPHKTDARSWTEPVNPQQRLGNGNGTRDSAETEAIRRLTEVVKKASAVGAELGAKVRQFANQLNENDPKTGLSPTADERLARIMKLDRFVDAEVAKMNQNRNQATA